MILNTVIQLRHQKLYKKEDLDASYKGMLCLKKKRQAISCYSILLLYRVSKKSGTADFQFPCELKKKNLPQTAEENDAKINKCFMPTS